MKFVLKGKTGYNIKGKNRNSPAVLINTLDFVVRYCGMISWLKYYSLHCLPH